ncbi:MAG: TRAP transporter substrate-binding protein DctP, partial [Chloroflexi bacterium]|nr:TRAP transporter substrate-binding protein DctP [Chloroflexota bacterium]
PALAAIVSILGTSCTGGGAATGDTGTPAPTAGSDEPIVLRMANSYGGLDQLPAVAYFVNRVEELSGGGIVITVADSYGDFAEDVEERVVRHVAVGDMDLGWVGTRVFDTMGLNSFQALTAPMLVDSYALQNAVIESGMTDEMIDTLDEVGVTGLGVLAGGLRKPIGTDGPIMGPADWQGIGFGTYRSEGQEAAIRALGATPALVFGPRREDAISSDTIQGFEMGMFIYQDPKWVALAPHVTANVSLWPQMDVLIVSPDRLESLTDEQQAWLQQAADDAAGRSADLADTDARASEAACEAGARFAEASEADLAALDDLFEPVYADLERDEQTRNFIEEIRALKESVSPESEPVIPPGCA